MVIYGILNKVSGKYYIGSAVNFSKRKSRHLKLLRENKHHSYLLQKEWDENLFDFIILEKVLGKEFLIEREQWWIDNTNSFYNICKIASSSLGVKRTEETKEKVRQANLGLKHPEWRNNIKSKAQGGENHWTKKKSFSKESKEKMSRSQKKLYEDGYVSPRLGVVLSKETIDKLINSVSKAILQFDLDMNLIKEWKSSKEASLNGYTAKYIIECCKNKRNKYKNSLWKYKK